MIDPEALLDRLGIEHFPRGGRLHAPCPHPDHPDRRPSWAAWQDDLGRFRHRCLACGFGGGPANLVMAALGCDRRAAHDFLDGSETAGPPPPPTVRVEVREPARAPIVEVPDEVWVEPLADWPAPPRRYLEDRGLGAREVERWGLGYAVDGRLGGRVWVPVRDRAGVLVSWTARAFDAADQKYDSSPHPAHRVLLGEHLWPALVLGWATCVVVEGPFDAIAVDAAVGCPVGALRGNASTGATIDPGQAAKLAASFDEVVIATDPDKAGEKYAALLAGLGRWVRIRKADLFAGADCAKLYQDGGAAALARALDLPARQAAVMEGRPSMTGWG